MTGIIVVGPGGTLNVGGGAALDVGEPVPAGGLPAPIAPCTQPANYVQTVLNDSPIGYWRLNDPGPSGTAALDVSGFGRDGVYTAGAGSFIFQQPGPFGIGDCSYEQTIPAQDPGGPRVVVSDSAFDFIGAPNLEWTMEIWALAFSGTVSETCISKSSGSRINEMIIPPSPFVTMRAQMFDGSAVNIDSAAVANNGTWQHHVIMRTIAGASTYAVNSMRYYQNGAPQSITVSNTRDFSHTSDLLIGNSGFYDNQWEGRLAHAAVYNYALTDAQVSNHHSVGTTNP